MRWRLLLEEYAKEILHVIFPIQIRNLFLNFFFVKMIVSICYLEKHLLKSSVGNKVLSHLVDLSNFSLSLYLQKLSERRTQDITRLESPQLYDLGFSVSTYDYRINITRTFYSIDNHTEPKPYRHMEWQHLENAPKRDRQTIYTHYA